MSREQQTHYKLEKFRISKSFTQRNGLEKEAKTDKSITNENNQVQKC